MNLFDFFHNSLFQQELKQSRRQISQQRAYDELEAEVYIDFATLSGCIHSTFGKVFFKRST